MGTLSWLSAVLLGPVGNGSNPLPMAIKVWAVVHVFSGMTAGTLGVYVSEQGVINDQTTVTLFVALGFAGASFLAGWRLSQLFSSQRVKRLEDYASLERQLGELAKTVARLAEKVDG